MIYRYCRECGLGVFNRKKCRQCGADISGTEYKPVPSDSPQEKP